MDRIFLHGMRFMACHGALPHEREVPQAFEADAELRLDLREAGETDDLRNTVNYAEVYELIRHVIEGAPKALIEALAEEAAADFSSMELLYPDEVPVFDKYDEYLPTELVRRGFAEGVLHTAEMRETVLSWRGARIDSMARA